MNLVETAEQIGKGSQIVLDWLGAGGHTVSQHEAQDRSDVCTGRLSGAACPYNVPSNLVTGLAGESIRHLIEIKNKAALRVDGEKKLGGCERCACHLKLKVWTPLAYIRKHTTDEEISSYPPICWLRTESGL